MNRARALVFNVAFFAWTALLGTIALPVLLMPRRTVMRFGAFWSRGVLFLLRTIVGLDHRIFGLDRILAQAFEDPAPIVERELLLLPIYGWYARRAGSIGIDRKAGAGALRRMVAAARKAVAEGRPIVIFPQGTRVMPGASMPYQPGVFALYRALSLPLVPAAVNSGLFWGRRSFLKRPGRITLEFLEPIPPGWPRGRLLEELEQRIETATAALETEAGGQVAVAPLLMARAAATPETSLPRRR
jgi:1-acyl-sn-glycerol-3-phosphate acyltransferase